MKHLQLFILFLIVFQANSQKIKGFGIDFGENIVPQILKYKGFGGNIFVEISNKNNKNLWLKLGYSDFGRSNNELLNSYYESKFDQRNKGFYFTFCKEINKYLAWQTTALVFDSYSTLRFKDTDFNANYTHTINNKSVFAVGAGITGKLPVRINNRLQTGIQATISVFFPFRFREIHKVIYAPGIGVSNKPVGLNLSIPLIFYRKNGENSH
jgi:hypothetical protein